MKLKFLGAAGEVTGSCLLVEADDARFLIDCGMFQGGRDAAPKNRRAYARELGRLDFVLLTHAHIDHCGLLPRFAWPRQDGGAEPGRARHRGSGASAGHGLGKACEVLLCHPDRDPAADVRHVCEQSSISG